MEKTLLILSALVLLAFPQTAKAEGDLVSVGIGWFDFEDNQDATDFRIEYRWDNPLFWVVEPWAGAEVTSDGGIYGGGGVLADFQIGNGFLITPSWGAGLYTDGGGKDLGSAIEFRTQLEMGWEFSNSSRIGIAASHISNAGLDDHNPGTEVLNVYYHIPADWF